MKMTNENKLEIVTLTYNIKQLCNKIDQIVLGQGGALCFSSGNFAEINYLFELAAELKKLNKD
jgi:hypothetical protein